MDREQFRKAAYQAVDRICDYFEDIESYDVVPDVQPGDIAKLIAKKAPARGEPWEAISNDFDRVILPGITHWQHPNFFAYFPANTTYECILADMYAGAVSNPGFNWLCSPACTELESVVMDWVAKLLGLDETWWNEGKVAGGVIQGSAHESLLTVCTAARKRYLTLNPDSNLEDLVIVGTTQTHSLGAKAALVLGLSFHAVETKAEDNWGLRGKALRDELEKLKADGKRPFILIATLGSTSTGAIDNLPEITAVTADYPDLFLHVDAAWAGVFLALPECRKEAHLDMINGRATGGREANGVPARPARGEVHSFCTNLHKSGLVTLDASTLWVRDRALLTSALDVTPPYLRTPQSTSNANLDSDFRNMQLALGRRFRSLKVWFTLRSYGSEGFQAHFRRLIGLGQVFEGLVLGSARGGEGEGLEGVELFTPRRFSLVVLRVRSTLKQEERDRATSSKKEEGNTFDLLKYENALNASLIRIANTDRSLLLTPTTVGGYNCVRIALGGPFVEKRHLEGLVGKLRIMVRQAREEMVESQDGEAYTR
ncbi:hypothetical protein JCM11641_002193 [Rhodosporidiobolus odoratus]